MEKQQDHSGKYLADTYGLVLCGGSSSRMQRNKGMIQYFEKAQQYHVYDMLKPYCEAVFISCKAEQAALLNLGYNHIIDNPVYVDRGPMAGVLSAFELYPEKNMLIIGCDYPFLSEKELQQFTTFCSGNSVSFYNVEADLYEPMLSWYSSNSYEALQVFFNDGNYSLQHFLKSIAAVKYKPKDNRSIISVDTKEAFDEVQKQINDSKNH